MKMSILETHRQDTLQLPPEKFLCYFPYTFVQYFDDSPQKDPLKAVSADRFDSEEARRRQVEGCGVYYSPNAFEGSRRLDCLVHIQAVLLDIDCAKEGDGQDRAEVEKRKEEAFCRLIGSKLPPHAITDTKNGLQVVWEVHPVGGEKGLKMFREAMGLLIRRFGGDKGAKDPTRVLRLPGFLHLKNPAEPYPCILVWNRLEMEPYDLQGIINEFYLPPEEPPPHLEDDPPHSPYSHLKVMDVICDVAKETGITVTFEENSDGSKQILENGVVTSGFISSRGNFCYSSSGNERKGGPLQVVEYYKKCSGADARKWLEERYRETGYEVDLSQFRELHPAQCFLSTTAFTTVILPRLANGKMSRTPCIITSTREKFPLTDDVLLERRFFTERHPNPDVRWEPSDVQAFLQGKPLSMTLPKLLCAIEEQSRQHIDFEDQRLHTFQALWVVGTYFHRICRTFPYIHLRGNRESGKSKDLQFLQLLSFNAEMFTSNSSSAYVIRAIHDNAATCCIDEVERLSHAKDDDAKAVLSMYNAGYKRGNFIGKCEQEGKQSKWKRKRFEAYSPKAFAGIRGLEGSLASRCIPITMLHSGNRGITNKEINDELSVWAELRNALYRCMMALHDKMRMVYENLTDNVLQGREFELWRPILSVALLTDASRGVYNTMRELAIEMQERKREDQREDIATPKLLEGLLKFLEEKRLEEYECSYSDLIEFLPHFDEQFEWLGDESIKKVRKSRWIGDELRAAGILASAAKKVRKAGEQKRMILLNTTHIRERLSTYDPDRPSVP